MSTTGSKSYYTTEDVEAMVITIMREEAIKSSTSRDTTVLTDAKDTVPLSTISGNKISSDDIIASKDAEKKKKTSCSRGTSKSKKTYKGKKSSSTKDKEEHSKAKKENEKRTSNLIKKILTRLYKLKQQKPTSEIMRDYQEQLQ